MKVSITEDATMSRTRSLGGAANVREEAIAKAPPTQPEAKKQGGENAALR
jgi:hypothetical protein